MKKLFLTFAIFSLTISCSKKTEVKGIVFSKHNVPCSGIRIIFAKYGSRSYPITDEEIGITDQNGFYHFTFKGKKKYRYAVVAAASDSGYAGMDKTITLGQVNDINFHLQ